MYCVRIKNNITKYPSNIASNRHYPQQKPTAVCDNPEMNRIKENSKFQSNVKYHEDFEKSKGFYTTVADDPEIKRALENSKIISQVTLTQIFQQLV